ncbi:hypothetical protein [Candidatus Viridilinea mediisalina]|uniref:Uncharacterized protein n=1 Tax=Candidatus Viridilinea mediisalina TaxID=2024553 RepID=A0A2A6RKU9_9CHLR|nr:hypothetical protein [Candidatus Viridilinea mediisalina]PDW03744.1 hypothetical protein CJ255_07115 [Candidatus Viridilinea mediisalina]
MGLFPLLKANTANHQHAEPTDVEDYDGQDLNGESDGGCPWDSRKQTLANAVINIPQWLRDAMKQEQQS